MLIHRLPNVIVLVLFISLSACHSVRRPSLANVSSAVPAQISKQKLGPNKRASSDLEKVGIITLVVLGVTVVWFSTYSELTE